MSVKVRLQRGGRSGLPIYSIVVTDSRKGRDKKFIEKLGFWAPKAKGQDVPFRLDETRLTHWVGVGAQVTDVVARLLIKQNVGPEKVRERFAKVKTRRIKTAEVVAKMKADGEARKAAAEAKKNGAPAEVPAETPAEVPATPAPAEVPAEQPVEVPAEQPAEAPQA
ncbi:MAG: 30S ribosomal protein S16 [Proteobacteria bacterium]|nr:30S ribosomal protein S16 [Pseudomonadota bacterium]